MRILLKRILPIIIVLSICLSAMGSVWAFSDVDKDNWADAYVQKASHAGIITGYPDGLFKPNADVKVGEFISMLTKIFATEIPQAKKGEYWALPCVSVLAKYIVIDDKKYSESELKKPLIREQATNLTALVYAKINNVTVDKSGKVAYKDSGKIKAEYVPYVSYCTQNNIINGFEDNTFRPQSTLKRNQAAKIISIIALTDKKDVMLMPAPSISVIGSEMFTAKNGLKIVSDNASQMKYTFDYLKSAFSKYAGVTLQASDKYEINNTIVFKKDTTLKKQGYKLNINKDAITILYSDMDGAFYGAVTLKQIVFQCKNKLPLTVINDSPSMLHRGITMDISRDRTPTVDTIKHVIDFCADLKINMLQLYIEGFPVEYKSFPSIIFKGNQLTADDLKELDEYCTERHIDFIPNINSFGHNGAFVNRPEFKQYAENPDGYTTEGGGRGWPDMLALTDDSTIAFLDKLYSDILPSYSSKYFVVGGDETYEIGTGKSKAMADKVGKGETYVYCLNRIYDLAKKYNRTMMFWGDIILKYPELVDQLPKDMIPVNWGYEYDYNFFGTSMTFQDSGLEYYVSPGTAAWGSIVGRTDNMLQNCHEAVENGLDYGASGILVTDWGDGGHWQHLPISYAGYIYGTSMAWNYENNKGEDEDMGAMTAKYLSRFVFMDKSEQMGKLLMDLGNYYENMEKRCWNNTYINMVAHTYYKDDSIFNGPWTYQSDEADMVVAQADAFLKKLDTIKLSADDGQTLMAEFRSNATILKVCAEFASMRRRLYDGAKMSDLKPEAITLKKEYDAMVKDYKRVWLIRNMYSGLDDSVNNMGNIGAFADDIIANG